MDRIYLVGEKYRAVDKTLHPVKKDFSLHEYVQEAKITKPKDMSINEAVVMQLQLDGCI